MNDSKELMYKIDRINSILIIHYSSPRKSKLLCIDENTTPLKLMDYLIDFIFVDQFELFKYNMDIFYHENDNKFPPLMEVHREDSKNLKFEINDLIVDIIYDVINKYLIFKKGESFRESNNNLILEEIIAKTDQYLKTRVHNLEGFLFSPINDILDAINTNTEFNETEDELASLTKLSDIFKPGPYYLRIMEILIKDGLCSEVTFIWKDEKKGNKRNCVAILKHLEIKGYYKLKRKLKPLEIQYIIKNTFNLDVGIDTIKGVNRNNYTSKIFEKIPPLS